jgi:autotransporter-associated beta strand protein
MAGTVDMEGTNSVRLAISNAPNFSTITANSGTLIYDVQGIGAYTNSAAISDNGGGLGTIVKAGTNLMVLAADNSTYTGAILVTNGTLQYTNAGCLGSASAPLYVTNNGTLDLNGIAPGAKNINIAGNGFNGKGALISSSANGLVNNGTLSLTMTADASIAASNRWDVVGSTFNANGHSLTVLGPGATLIEIAGDGTLADIHIVAGRLGFQSALVSMGDSTRTCTVESNAVLTLFTANVTKNLALNGSAILDSGGSGNTFNGAVMLNGNNLFGLRTDLHLEANVSGAGGLLVSNSPVNTGAGRLFLDGNNTYSGSTTIAGGYGIVVGASSSLGSSSLIQVNSGGTLDVTAPASLNLGAGQTLIGAGSVLGGSTIIGSGATLAPGFPDNNTYTLTINGNLTLQAGSTNSVVVKKATSVANDTVAGLTSVAIGGTLVVNNVGNPLAGGDAIQLFSSTSYSGTFNNIIPATPGAGLAWDQSTLDTDGNVRVISTIPTSPTNLVFSVANNVLTLSWPSSYTGWTLQAQTNPPGVGLTTNWFDIPGSATSNSLVVPIGAGNGSVFYRMSLHP